MNYEGEVASRERQETINKSPLVCKLMSQERELRAISLQNHLCLPDGDISSGW